MKSMEKYNKQIIMISFSRLINCLGNLVFPFITFIILKILKVDVQYIGLVIMILTLCRIPGAFLGGKMSDKFNVKLIWGIPMIFVGSILIILPNISNNFIFIVGLAISRFITGFTTPANTKLLTLNSTKENKTSVFALMYWLTNIGNSVSMLLGGFIFAESYKLLFFIDGITRIISGIIILLLKQNRNLSNEITKQSNYPTNIKQYYKNNTIILKYIAINLIFSFAYAQYSFAIPLKLEAEFQSASTQLYSIMMFTNCITVILLTFFITKILHNLHVFKRLSIAFIFLGFGLGIMFFNCSLVLLIVATIIWSLGEIIFATYKIIFISDYVPIDYLGRVMGLNDSLETTITAIAPFINSLIIFNFGLSNSWIFVFIICLIGAIAIRCLPQNFNIKNLSIIENNQKK